jgi:hypothetical protein
MDLHTNVPVLYVTPGRRLEHADLLNACRGF